jgi:hypothetical protein
MIRFEERFSVDISEIPIGRGIARFALAGAVICGFAGGAAAAASAQETTASAPIDQGQVVTGVPAPLPEDEAGIGGDAVAAAIRCQAHAGIGGDGISYLSYTGSAVDCHPTWTYSFRLRFTSLGGTTRAEYLLEGKRGATSYTLPTFNYLFSGGSPSGCSVLRVYHSATVGQTLVDSASSCYGGWSRAPAE